MWNYAVYTIFLCYMGYHLVSVARQRLSYGIWETCALTCFFSILFLSGWKPGLDIIPLAIIGFVLYVPAVFFLALSFIDLRRRGKPRNAWEQTTVIIDSGAFGVVRHPLYTGIATWALGLMLVFQSILSLVLGALTIFCCWMACKTEERYNLNKFGDEYRDYMESVPMCNFVKGAWNLKR